MNKEAIVRFWRFVVTLLCLVSIIPLTAQAYFGQNKVQYKDFEWYVMPTVHFDIHYYVGGEELAYMTAKWAEEAHDHIARGLGRGLSHRIPIIIYTSHLDFQQTNVTQEIIEEGLQGFTESLKNRIVIHFQGSYADYKHLITHEMVHAFQYDFLFSDNMSPQQYMLDVPLWLMEGMAEYFSHFEESWDTETEMWMREAVVSNNLVPITEMDYYGGYIVYKQGQAIVRYLAKKYGERKLGELLEQLRMSRGFSKALERTYNISLEKLSDEWVRAQKRHFWPQFAELQTPDEISKQLTDHKKDGHYMNLRPTFSPDGNTIAFFSDRKEYMNIFLMSSHDGSVLKQLVKAEQTGGYEALNAYESNISWSPEGDYLVMVSKFDGRNHIYLINVKNGHIFKQFDPGFDMILSPDWSPDGQKIVFSAMKDGRRDLYILEIKTGNVQPLTQDRYDDRDPRWAPDNKSIIFATDRPHDAPQTEAARLDSTAGDFEYRDFNIARYDLSTSFIELVVDLPGDDIQPDWAPSGRHIVYVSDYSGGQNLHIYSFEEDQDYRLGNITGGVYEPCWASDGERIAFSTFQDWGRDIFIVEDPLNSKFLTPLSEVQHRSPGDLAHEFDETMEKMLDLNDFTELGSTVTYLDEPVISAPLLLGSTALDSTYLRKTLEKPDTTVTKSRPEINSTAAEEPVDYSIRRYKPSLSPDYVSGGVAYANDYGFYGGTIIAFSDILGNNHLQILGNLGGAIDETDIFAMYYHLPRRLDFGFGVFHEKNNYLAYDYTTDYYYEIREFGAVGLVSYPFSRYERIDFTLTARGVDRRFSEIEYYDDYGIETGESFGDTQFIIQPTIAFVKDTSLWGYTGPINGMRASLSISHSPSLIDKELEYTTGILDYRRYQRITRRHQLAIRALFAMSTGPYSDLFGLGGPYTLRGYDYNDLVGKKIGLVNMELRFPFIEQLFLRWPLPIALQGIRGALFLDLGAAWDETENFRGIQLEDGKFQLNDIKASFGVGARMRVGFMVLKFDLANKTNFGGYTSNGVFQFSIGSDF